MGDRTYGALLVVAGALFLVPAVLIIRAAGATGNFASFVAVFAGAAVSITVATVLVRLGLRRFGD